MRYWSDEGIAAARAKSEELTVKLGSLKPNGDLDRDDIRSLMFILRQYDIELKTIQHERRANARMEK